MDGLSGLKCLFSGCWRQFPPLVSNLALHASSAAGWGTQHPGTKLFLALTLTSIIAKKWRKCKFGEERNLCAPHTPPAFGEMHFSRPAKSRTLSILVGYPGTIVPGYFQSPYRAEDWNTRIKFLVAICTLD